MENKLFDAICSIIGKKSYNKCQWWIWPIERLDTNNCIKIVRIFSMGFILRILRTWDSYQIKSVVNLILIKNIISLKSSRKYTTYFWSRKLFWSKIISWQDFEECVGFIFYWSVVFLFINHNTIKVYKFYSIHN